MVIPLLPVPEQLYVIVFLMKSDKSRSKKIFFRESGKNLLTLKMQFITTNFNREREQASEGRSFDNRRGFAETAGQSMTSPPPPSDDGLTPSLLRYDGGRQAAKFREGPSFAGIGVQVFCTPS